MKTIANIGGILMALSLTALGQDDKSDLSATSQGVKAETVKREMLSIYGAYHDPIERLIAKTGPPLKLNIYDIQGLPVWHKGRVVLIGDAAHAVSPSAG